MSSCLALVLLLIIVVVSVADIFPRVSKQNFVVFCVKSNVIHYYENIYVPTVVLSMFIWSMVLNYSFRYLNSYPYIL